MNRYEKATQNRDKANQLNKVWSVGAAQALYRETGNWYHRLTRFPGALFDSYGYILFSTEDELQSLHNVQVGKQISVPKGIASLPSYVRVVDVSPEEITAPARFWEGTLRRIVVNAFERDTAARRMCIAHFGATCAVCDFDFAATYGELGGGFIHVHHKRPLSEVRAGYTVDPKQDLIPVCPNCHAMLHQTSPPLTIEKLRERLRRATTS